VVSYIPTFIFFTLSAMTGLIMYAYFEGCDPIQAGVIERPDQMIPLLVIKVFQEVPGMAGLFVSAVVSGALRYFLFSDAFGVNFLHSVFPTINITKCKMAENSKPAVQRAF